jgi:hypothetical protein
MSQIVAQSSRTEHAWLVLLGEYARQQGLTQALNAVPLQQKVRTHRPQTKVIEFLVAILAGLPHLEDISRDGHPLDQDGAVALAWQQAAWADYSGVSRTLQGLSMSEAQAIGAVLDRFSQPFIDEAVVTAMRTQGRLVYDGDLTGRPVSDTSTTYPGVAYGHMDDAVHLGYQAAVVSLESPIDQRLWLSVQPHPGNTVSCTQVAAMVAAAEQRTCVRPLRRTELLRQRLLTVTEQRLKAEDRLKQRQTALAQAQVRRQHRLQELAAAQAAVTQLAATPRPRQRPERPYSQLAQAQARVVTKQRQADRQQHVVAEAQRRVSRQRELVVIVRSQEQTLQLCGCNTSWRRMRPTWRRYRLYSVWTLASAPGITSPCSSRWGMKSTPSHINIRTATPVSMAVLPTRLGSLWAAMPRWWRGQVNNSRPALTHSMWRLSVFTLARRSDTVSWCTLAKTASPKTCPLGSLSIISGKPLKLASRKVKLSSKCIISRFAPLQRCGCKSSLLPLLPTSFAGRTVGWIVTVGNGQTTGPLTSLPASKPRFRLPLRHQLLSIGSLTVVC